MSVWVTSDLHLNDPHILKHVNIPFENLDAYNNYIIQRFNSVVQVDDLVYILGDLGFKPKEQLSKLVRQLNGRKVLIIGNHDQLTDGDYLKMGIIKVVRHPIYYSEHVILSHIPVQEAYNNPYVYNIHGHLHSDVLSLPNYYNINLFQHNGLPLDLKKIVYTIEQEFQDKPHRWEAYHNEWYASFEKSYLS